MFPLLCTDTLQRMTDAMFVPEGQGNMSWFESDSMPGLYFW